MKRVLITGASGNIGIELLSALEQFDHDLALFLGVRNPKGENEKLEKFKHEKVKFDFTDIDSFALALRDVDILFLLRPPQISDVTKFFKPLIESAKKASVKHIVFLSVQGVESSTIIPHHKIEQLITQSKIPYTFLRPAYFMQNFTTTLRDELVNNKRIFLPAGKAKFTLIDTEDIGLVAAKVLINSSNHTNKSYELTNNEKLNFGEMAEKLTIGLNKKITFDSPNLLRFFFYQKNKGVPTMLILVMIMLHYLPRFQKSPNVTSCFKMITGKEAKTFDEFILANKNKLQ